MLRDLLAFNNVRIVRNAKVSKIGNQEIKVLQDNNEETIATEQTIVAVLIFYLLIELLLVEV